MSGGSHTERPISSSNEKAITKDDQIIEVPHIDFIFRDRQLRLEDCEQMIQIKYLKHQFIRAQIQSRSKHQMKQSLTSIWDKRLCHALSQRGV